MSHGALKEKLRERISNCKEWEKRVAQKGKSVLEAGEVVVSVRERGLEETWLLQSEKKMIEISKTMKTSEPMESNNRSKRVN